VKGLSVTEQTTRDAKLIQYLNEAYGKERELETALQAHIAMTTRAPYRKRLQEHLTETKRHARELERRIKRLGGVPEVLTLPGPDVVSQGASAAVELGSRALAAAKGPLHAIRGTGEQEKMLKNAKTEYSEEHEEIATYTAIEVLATAVGDKDTAKLAKAIRREEERMAKFLERLIPALTKAVIQEEIPARERASSRPARRKTATRSSGTSSTSRKTGKAASSAARKTGKAARNASSSASRSASTAKGKAKAKAAAPKRTAKKASGRATGTTRRRATAGSR
jgi:ferritin-like metal-binding protein YciE